VEKANVDFLAIAVHKWLMASEGTALIYIVKSAEHDLPDLYGRCKR